MGIEDNPLFKGKDVLCVIKDHPDDGDPWVVYANNTFKCQSMNRLMHWKIVNENGKDYFYYREGSHQEWRCDVKDKDYDHEWNEETDKRFIEGIQLELSIRSMLQPDPEPKKPKKRKKKK